MLIWDGFEISIQKSSDRKIQNLTYSMKNKVNCLRHMLGVVPDSIIFDVIPNEGIFPTGRSSDNSIMDWILLVNAQGIHQKVDMAKAILNADRGFERMRIRLIYHSLTVLLPCVLRSNKNMLEGFKITNETSEKEILDFVTARAAKIQQELEKKENKKKQKYEEKERLSQQPTLIANMGRLSTITRFVAEKAVSHIKSKYIFKHVLPLKLVNQVGMFFFFFF